MLVLGAGDSLYGVAGTATAITVTATGVSVTTSSGAEVLQKLYQGQLPSAAASLFTVPAGQSYVIKTLTVTNSSGSSVAGISLFISGSATSNSILGGITIASGSTATFGENGWQVTDANGQILVASITGGITQLTGDVTAGPGSGSQIATVVHAPAAGITGTTLASNVVSSSLTSVGTLASGAVPTSLLTGTLLAAQEPAHTGDMTNTAGSLATSVVKVNGVTYGSSPSTNTVPVVTGANTVTYEAVPNAALANSTISGVSLGSSLNTLTFGTHLTSGGASYNGSSNITITSDATNLNTASSIVARDGSGNFSAGTITASLTGTASNATGVNGAAVPTSAKALASNASNQIIAATLAGTGAGLTTGPTTSVSGDVATFTGTAGQIADSGKAITGAGTAIPTGPSSSTSGDLVSFTGTAGQIADSGKSLTGSGTAVPTGPSSSTSGDVVTFTGVAGQIADSGTLLTALAPKASPTFTGSVTLPLTTAGLVTTTAGGVIGSEATATIAQGGTGTGSTLTGLVRGSATAMTAAELSGDATTSGSNAVTVVKVNGGSIPASQPILASNASNQIIGATTTGSGTTAVLSTNPTFTTDIVTPVVYGGGAAGSTLTLDGTSNGSPSSAYVLLNPLGQGYVGIGTTNPQTQLDIVNSQQTSTIINSNKLIRLSSNANGADATLQITDGIANNYLISGAQGNMYFSSGGSNPAPQMTILSTGSVGIGTTTPHSKLAVVGLPVYANNAAAITGGLATGDFYQDGGNPSHVCVVQ